MKETQKYTAYICSQYHAREDSDQGTLSSSSDTIGPWLRELWQHKTSKAPVIKITEHHRVQELALLEQIREFAGAHIHSDQRKERCGNMKIDIATSRIGLMDASH